jgi:hypothetical protein
MGSRTSLSTLEKNTYIEHLKESWYSVRLTFSTVHCWFHKRSFICFIDFAFHITHGHRFLCLNQFIFSGRWTDC